MKQRSRLSLALLSLCLLAGGARAQESAETAAPPTGRSALDAVLFYQILIGELNVREGSPGAGFSLVLDAARKTRDEGLFRRAVEIALQARSGEAALQAAQAWKREWPTSAEPERYTLQILLALNRIDEAAASLVASIDALPTDEKASAIIAIPRVLARVQDKTQVASAVQKALQGPLRTPSLQLACWTTLGRLWRNAELWPQAIEATHKAHTLAPQDTGVVLLAISLLPSGSAQVREMLDASMQGPVAPELRLGYARNLIALRQFPDALTQLQQLSRQHPDFAPAWLLLGLLQAEAGDSALARQNLQQYLTLAASSQDKDIQAGMTEAFMALSQLAQQAGQIGEAERWLARITSSADPVRLAQRRAELLDQQGRSAQALQLLREVPTSTAEQAKQKTLALSRWLREHQQATLALPLLEEALTDAHDDLELLTEQSLVLEKLGRHAEMETVLTHLMRTHPQDPHAYNALGYSLAERGVRLDEARKLILQALELSAQDPFIQDSLGWVEFKRGQLQQAQRILAEAYRRRPDAEIAAHLGEVLWSSGDKEAAAQVWREGLRLKPDNQTLLETIRRLGFRP